MERIEIRKYGKASAKMEANEMCRVIIPVMTTELARCENEKFKCVAKNGFMYVVRK